MKVNVRQQTEGTPGFVEDEIFEVRINTDLITLFNKSEDNPNITFVRLTCGATLIVDMKPAAFINKLKKIAPDKSVEK